MGGAGAEKARPTPRPRSVWPRSLDGPGGAH